MSTAYSSKHSAPGLGSGDALDPGLTRRYWLTLLGAAVIALAVVGVLLAVGVVPPERTEMVVHYYLITWVLFCIVFLYASLRHWAAVDIPTLPVPAESPGRNWRAWLSGIGSPESWSLQSGVFSAIIVIAASRLTGFQDHLWLPVLGLFTVAGSWGLMVVAYAEQYLRLHLQGGGSGPARRRGGGAVRRSAEHLRGGVHDGGDPYHVPPGAHRRALAHARGFRLQHRHRRHDGESAVHVIQGGAEKCPLGRSAPLR